MKKGCKTVLCMTAAAMLSITSVTGCSTKENTSESVSDYAGENTLDMDCSNLTKLVAQVSKVDGNAVTLSVGQMGNGEAPQKPDGEAPQKPDGEMPETPSGEAPQMPQMQEAVLTINDASVIQVDGKNGSLKDIEEGVFLEISFDADRRISEIAVSAGDHMQMGDHTSAQVENYKATTEYTKDTSESKKEYVSEGTDENAIHVYDGADVTLDQIKVKRTSDESAGGDTASFYGVGAAVLNTDGVLNLTKSDIETDANGAAGVFAYGKGVVNVSDTKIKTSKNTAGGIHVAGGGTLYADNLDVETDGESSAAIRSDRGGGTMVVDGGNYTSNGVGSPAIYCTADIAVNNASLTANGSEAICMEGLNQLHLFNCAIKGNMKDLEENDTTWTMIVYQSMSGDSEAGNSDVQLVGGSMTSGNGGLIYTTNTESNILMSNVEVSYADNSEFFLMCTGNKNSRGWGKEGSNGADCKFTADRQKMAGNVVWDSISHLNFYMTNGSVLEGAVLDDETYASHGGDGECNLYIGEDSEWKVTGDSRVSNLYSAGTIFDDCGNVVSIVGTDGTVYEQGTSDYTITVDTYSHNVDLSDVEIADSWSDYSN